MTELCDAVADALEAVRARSPHVHCITNSVAQTFTANTLLAVGAVPSMTIWPEEVGEFVGNCDGLLVNLGTFDDMRMAAVDAALPAAERHGVPWALDPAHAESSPHRLRLARKLIGHGPSVLRCNRAEFEALYSSPLSIETVRRAAAKQKIVLAVTGEQDIVSDGSDVIVLENGHPLQAKVTAAGCVTTAVVAAYLAAGMLPLVATVAGLSAVAIAAEIAAETARGPGSLQIGFLDELDRLTPEAIGARLRMTQHAPTDDSAQRGDT